MTACDGEFEKRWKIPETISLDHASHSRDITVASAPNIMKGFLLPNGDRQLSLMMPTYGCTRAPVSGPAIQTIARKALLIPSESRKGEPFDSSTDHTIWSPPMLSVSKKRYSVLLCSTIESARPRDSEWLSTSSPGSSGEMRGDRSPKSDDSSCEGMEKEMCAGASQKCQRIADFADYQMRLWNGDSSVDLWLGQSLHLAISPH